MPATRSKNANQHPGKIVQPRKRRTAEEMQQAKEAEAAEKQRSARKKNDSAKRIAEMEDRMAEDDEGAVEMAENDENTGASQRLRSRGRSDGMIHFTKRLTVKCIFKQL